MSKLCDVGNGCNFENKDEIVKFLFLIHYTNKKVKDQLIRKDEDDRCFSGYPTAC